MATKYRDLIKLLEADGWVLKRITGSHQHYQHPTKIGTVTVAAGGKMNRVIPPGTLNNVLKRASLKQD